MRKLVLCLLCLWVLAGGCMAEEVGGITVGAVAFSASEDAGDGETWRYDSNSRTLTLSGYDGGAIASEASLEICVEGDNRVRAGMNTCGISVKEGDLILVQRPGSSLEVRAGGRVEGDTRPAGDGICADNGLLLVELPQTANLRAYGGRSDGKDAEIGYGHAMTADRMELYLGGSLSLLGGENDAVRAGAGIFAGTLLMRVDGVVNITGGRSTRGKGSHGILASDACSMEVNGWVTVAGGASNYSEGGSAISSDGDIRLSGQGGVTATGGSGRLDYGGFAVLGDRIYVHVHDFEAVSGVSAKNSPAVGFDTLLELGLTNAKIRCGTQIENGYAVGSTGSDAEWIDSKGITYVREEDMDYETKIKTVTMSLDGNGGYWNGQKTVSLEREYGQALALQSYRFRNSGYVLTGWKVGLDRFVAVDGVYSPVGYDRLTAQWTRLENGKLLFLADGQAESHGEEAAAPEREGLLGWCDAPNTWDEEGILQGVWYAAGDAVAPVSDAATVLYARNTDGLFAAYHCNGGQWEQGGTLKVQGKIGYANSLRERERMTVTALDEASLTRAGYEFAGWNTAPDGSGETVSAGAPLQLTYGEPVRLYAQWEPAAKETQVGEVLFREIAVEGTLEIHCPAADRLYAALYDENGQFLRAVSAAGTKLTVPLQPEAALCRLFCLTEAWHPTGPAAALPLL